MLSWRNLAGRNSIMLQHDGPDQQTLHCMEIWGGIEPVEPTVRTPGLDLWVFSQPFEGDEQGGDVHYVTLCGGGLITRIVVADVSGHGSSVAEFSSIPVLAPQAHQPEEPEPAGRAAQPGVHRDGPAAPVRHGGHGHVSHVNRSAHRLQRRPSPPALFPGDRRLMVDPVAGSDVPATAELAAGSR